jgi:hypothetical protein
VLQVPQTPYHALGSVLRFTVILYPAQDGKDDTKIWPIATSFPSLCTCFASAIVQAHILNLIVLVKSMTF